MIAIVTLKDGFNTVLTYTFKDDHSLDATVLYEKLENNASAINQQIDVVTFAFTVNKKERTLSMRKLPDGSFQTFNKDPIEI